MDAPQRDDARMQAIQCWLRDVLPGAGALVAASSDASFRRYFRTECDGATFIVMDAPPEQEDCAPFVQVAEWLTRQGLAAPRVLQQDLRQGFLLLDDLGNQTLLQQLQAAPADEAVWYQRAIDLLVDMQRADQAVPLAVPAYDTALLERELELFPVWFVRQLREVHWGAPERAVWEQLKTTLIAQIRQQPAGLVHRDFHSRNLMVRPQNGLAMIDFQDAVRGARSYDLISLLRDSYRRLSPERYRQLQQYYLEQAQTAGVLPADLSGSEFTQQCAAMAMQRHLKVAGIFARLWLRDGKRAYLQDIPLTLDYLAEVCRLASVDGADWLLEQLQTSLHLAEACG